MNNTNRFLIVRDSGGEVATSAYYADSLAEAQALAESLEGRWMVCVVVDVKEAA